MSDNGKRMGCGVTWQSCVTNSWCTTLLGLLFALFWLSSNLGPSASSVACQTSSHSQTVNDPNLWPSAGKDLDPYCRCALNSVCGKNFQKPNLQLKAHLRAFAEAAAGPRALFLGLGDCGLSFSSSSSKAVGACFMTPGLTLASAR